MATSRSAKRGKLLRLVSSFATAHTCTFYVSRNGPRNSHFSMTAATVQEKKILARATEIQQEIWGNHCFTEMIKLQFEKQIHTLLHILKLFLLMPV